MARASSIILYPRTLTAYVPLIDSTPEAANASQIWSAVAIRADHMYGIRGEVHGVKDLSIQC